MGVGKYERFQNIGTIIFLHGLGGDSTSWETKLKNLFSDVNEELCNRIKIFCPQSPEMPITQFNQRPMKAWFNFYDEYYSDNQGISNTAKFVHNLINLEVASGTPVDKIILCGHSQGGAVALYSALTYKSQQMESDPMDGQRTDEPNDRLGAVAVFGAWLPMLYQFQCKDSELIDTKIGAHTILQIHGELDWIIPYQLAKTAQRTITKYADECEMKTYRDAGHDVTMPQMFDFKQFCLSVLKIS